MDERLDARLKDLPPSAVHGVIARIAEIDEFKGWWAGREPPSPAVLGRLKKRVVAVSADAASRAGRTGERDPSRAAGYADALRAVFDGHGDMALGEDLVLRLHARLLGRPPAGAAAGGYRTAPGPAPARPRRGLESVALRPADPLLAPG